MVKVSWLANAKRYLANIMPSQPSFILGRLFLENGHSTDYYLRAQPKTHHVGAHYAPL